tara:strand:+ start:6707 stop:7045 length:339 start_codon:yes stop_codon:yes gene_type:complete
MKITKKYLQRMIYEELKRILSEEPKKSPEEQIKAKASGMPGCKESQVKCFPSDGGKPYAPSKEGEAPCRGTDKLKCDTGSQRAFEKFDETRRLKKKVNRLISEVRKLRSRQR